MEKSKKLTGKLCEITDEYAEKKLRNKLTGPNMYACEHSQTGYFNIHLEGWSTPPHQILTIKSEYCIICGKKLRKDSSTTVTVPNTGGKDQRRRKRDHPSGGAIGQEESLSSPLI